MQLLVTKIAPVGPLVMGAHAWREPPVGRESVLPVRITFVTSSGKPISELGSESPSEPDLIEAMAAGSTSAARDLFRRQSALVYALALRIVKDEEAAREVLVDTFHQVWSQAKDSDRSRGTAVGWLLSIARTRAIDRWRARIRIAEKDRRLVENAPQLPGPSPVDPETLTIRADLRRTVREAVAELPMDQRAAVEMSFFHSLTHSEVAERLGQPLGTVKTRIRLALAKLHRALVRKGKRS